LERLAAPSDLYGLEMRAQAAELAASIDRGPFMKEPPVETLDWVDQAALDHIDDAAAVLPCGAPMFPVTASKR
jgi:hypothetical protein